MTELEYIYNASISKIVSLTHDRNQLEKYLLKPAKDSDCSKLFVRDTTLSLSRLLAFMIMPRADSCQSELELFFNGIGHSIPTKSAFSMKRKFISPEIFRFLNREIIDELYSQPNIKQWKGKYIIAVDGTTITMPVGPRFEPLFGSAGFAQNKAKRLPTARAIVLMDVLNNQILDIRLDKYGCHEPDMAIAAIMDLPRHILDNAIFVFDRLYLSYWLLTYLQNNNIQYIMRCRRNFSPVIDAFFESKEKYADAQISPSITAWAKKTEKRFENMGITPEQYRPIFLHLTKSQLPHGELEVICSWIAGIKISAAQAYELYGRRWSVETAIGMEKNEWQIEIFSGYSKIAILQDIYCKVISYNLCAMATTAANKKLHQHLLHRKSRKTNEKELNRGHCQYRVNVDMALFSFKQLVIQAVKGKNKLHTLILRYIKEASRYYEPYRPGYSNPRNFFRYKTHGKYATFINYARVL